MDPPSIALTRPEPDDVQMPHVKGAPRSSQTRFVSCLVEQAQVDCRCVLTKQREVHATAVPGRAERVESARLDRRPTHREGDLPDLSTRIRIAFKRALTRLSPSRSSIGAGNRQVQLWLPTVPGTLI